MTRYLAMYATGWLLAGIALTLLIGPLDWVAFTGGMLACILAFAIGWHVRGEDA